MHEHGTISWSVRRSFLEYVRRMLDGEVAAVDGASLAGIDEGADARFPVVTCDDPTVLVAAVGSVRCTGHHGMLAVAFAEPRIVLGGDGLVVTIRDDDAEHGRLAIATADDWSIDGGSLRIAAPTLTDDGADLFFGNYRTGTPLSPLTADLDAAALAALQAASVLA